MNDLQKKIGWHQALFFLAVVGALGLPYLVMTMNLSGEQIQVMFAVYAWEGLLFLGLCTFLPMYWARHIPVLGAPLAHHKAGDERQLSEVLAYALRYPLLLARRMSALVLIGYSLGIWQVRYFAHINNLQVIQAFGAGIMLSLIYSMCCFFASERLISAQLGVFVRSRDIPALPRVLSIGAKIQFVCIAILLVAILFQSSIAVGHSHRLVKDLITAKSLQELQMLNRLLSKFEVLQDPDRAAAVLAEDSAGDGSAVFILGEDGKVISAPGNVPGSTESAAEWKALHARLKTLQEQDYQDPERERLYQFLRMSEEPLLLVRSSRGGEVEQGVASLLRVILVQAVLVLAVAFYLSYGLARSVSGPLTELERAANRIAEGDMIGSVEVVTGDEVGSLTLSFNRMQANLSDLIREVKGAILELGSAVNEILSTAEEQASGAGEQAASVGQVTATAEELSSTARQIAENSDIQAGMAESTQKHSEEGAAAMAEAAGVMEEIRQRTEMGAKKIMSLGEKSQQIGRVLAIINEVAAETKMLSLNAAIEASKAGEVGKGFSVVAGEIRKLAENVVKSTETIEHMVREIQSSANASVMAAEENVKVVSTGVKELKRLQDCFREILSMAERTTDSARQVSLATEQQRSANEQVVASMRELSDVAKQMATAARETTRSANSLNQMAERLKALISKFQLKD